MRKKLSVNQEFGGTQTGVIRVQICAGFIVGWLVANIVAGMRPKSWLELIDEFGAKLIKDIEVKLGVHDGAGDWGG